MNAIENIFVFLDFDGVLHPYAPWPFTESAKRRHFQHLPRLESVLRDFSEVRIVIASDWRHHNCIKQLRSPFSEDLRPRIVGTLALERSQDKSAGHRQRLAEKFLEENALTGSRWSAIDDVKENYRPDAPLVLCTDCFGDAQERQLRQLLQHACSDS